MKLGIVISIFMFALVAIPAMAANYNYDWDLSKSYEKHYGTNDQITIGYDVGSIFPFDDVFGWTYLHCGYFNESSGILNSGMASVTVTALNNETSTDTATYIEADGVIYASCYKISGQDYAVEVFHEGRADNYSYFSYTIT